MGNLPLYPNEMKTHQIPAVEKSSDYIQYLKKNKFAFKDNLEILKKMIDPNNNKDKKLMRNTFMNTNKRKGNSLIIPSQDELLKKCRQYEKERQQISTQLSILGNVYSDNQKLYLEVKDLKQKLIAKNYEIANKHKITEGIKDEIYNNFEDKVNSLKYFF